MPCSSSSCAGAKHISHLRGWAFMGAEERLLLRRAACIDACDVYSLWHWVCLWWPKQGSLKDGDRVQDEQWHVAWAPGPQRAMLGSTVAATPHGSLAFLWGAQGQEWGVAGKWPGYVARPGSSVWSLSPPGLSHLLPASQECTSTRSVLPVLITPSLSAIHNFTPTLTVLFLQADPACPLMAHHLLTFLWFSSPDTPPLSTSVPFLLTALSHLVSGCWKKMPWTRTCFLDSQEKYFFGWHSVSLCKSWPLRRNRL